jgi:hypothetical protein
MPSFAVDPLAFTVIVDEDLYGGIETEVTASGIWIVADYIGDASGVDRVLYDGYDADFAYADGFPVPAFSFSPIVLPPP